MEEHILDAWKIFIFIAYLSMFFTLQGYIFHLGTKEKFTGKETKKVDKMLPTLISFLFNKDRFLKFHMFEKVYCIE